jgi:hypothetical protein
MNSWYPHWFLDCPRHHLSPIPHPIPTETNDRPHMTPTGIPVLNVLCHECRIVYGYSLPVCQTADQRNTVDSFATGDFFLAATQVECDGENCKAPKTVYAILERHKGTRTPRIDPKNWQFDDSARCHMGEHKLHLPKGRRFLWEARAVLSF